MTKIILDKSVSVVRGGEAHLLTMRHELDDGRRFAVKIDVEDTKASQSRLKNEFNIMQALNKGLSKDHVPKAFACRRVVYPGAPSYDGHLSIVMEYLEGATLKQHLEEGGRLELEVAASLAMKLVSAASCIQSDGFLMRDYNPGNVLLTTAGVVKVIDFGVACEMSACRSDRLKLRNGVEPPEALGEIAEGWSASSDVYMIAECIKLGLFGRRVDSNDLPRTRFYDWLRKCTEKRPVDRPRDCAEARDLLQVILFSNGTRV